MNRNVITITCAVLVIAVILYVYLQINGKLTNLTLALLPLPDQEPIGIKAKGPVGFKPSYMMNECAPEFLATKN